MMIDIYVNMKLKDNININTRRFIIDSKNNFCYKY